MSGPWDRRAPDRDPDDPWSGGDPWGERQTEPSSLSSWDSWAPSPISPDALPDDAELPVNDPWAESWTDDSLPGALPAPDDRWDGEDGPDREVEAPAPRIDPWPAEPEEVPPPSRADEPASAWPIEDAPPPQPAPAFGIEPEPLPYEPPRPPYEPPPESPFRPEPYEPPRESPFEPAAWTPASADPWPVFVAEDAASAAVVEPRAEVEAPERTWEPAPPTAPPEPELAPEPQAPVVEHRPWEPEPEPAWEPELPTEPLPERDHAAEPPSPAGIESPTQGDSPFGIEPAPLPFAAAEPGLAAVDAPPERGVAAEPSPAPAELARESALEEVEPDLEIESIASHATVAPAVETEPAVAEPERIGAEPTDAEPTAAEPTEAEPTDAQQSETATEAEAPSPEAPSTGAPATEDATPVEPVPDWLATPIWDREAEWGRVDDTAQPAAADMQPSAEAERPTSPEPEPPRAGSGGEPAAETAPAPAPVEPPRSPEGAAGAPVGAEPEPAAERRPWEARPDATQVLPAGWASQAEASEALAEPRRGELEPQVGPIRVSLADARPAVVDEDLDDRPTTAEQAVPWLIGVILLLAGMVIVLMALIFLGDASLGASEGSPPPEQLGGFVPSSSAASSPVPTSTPEASSSPAATTPADPTPTPLALPEYGPLEIIFQGRSAALAPIYLLHDDFTTTDAAEVLAQDAELDVRRFAWAPEGTAGAGLLADLLVTVEPGVEKRPLGRGIVAMTFGDDASTLYAVRLAEDGQNDVATVLQIDYASGDATELGSVSYPRPPAPAGGPLVDAQIADDGGGVRLVWLEDDTLRLWVVGVAQWEVVPGSSELTEMDADAPAPTLWAPDGDRRIAVAYEGETSILRALDEDEDEVAAVEIAGRASHVRWSPGGDRVVFTVGTLGPNGGVIQDLYLWDVNAEGPMKLTTTGANFGAEWRGSQPLWRP